MTISSSSMHSSRPGSVAPGDRRRIHAVRAAAHSLVETLEQRTLLSSVLTPVADTFVRDHNYALTNFGASPLLFVKNASSGDNRVTFLKFDLTGLTSVNSAVLQLSGSLQTAQAPATDTGVYAVSDTSWVEGNGTIVNSIGDGFDTDNSPSGEMTWNNQPAVDGPLLATATVSRSTFQAITFDVTQYIQQQINAGATQVTLALENIQPTAQETEFLSRESTSQGAGPQLVITDSSSTPPSAVVSASDVNDPAATEVVNVTYSSPAGIDTSTIDTGDITVTPAGGGSPLGISGVNAATNSDGSVTASYVVATPGGGSWSADSNGAYTVSLAAGAVTDSLGLGVSAAFGSFRVSVADTSPPTSAISAPDITTAGGGNYTFTIAYNDNVAVDPSTITLDNVAVTGPGGPLQVTGVTVSAIGNGGYLATYTVAAPNGAWDAGADGQYIATLHDSQVADTAGNTAPANFANFNVAINAPDTSAPFVSAINAPGINASGGASETVVVTYGDNVAVNTSTIDANDITVVGPGGDALLVTGATFAGSGQTVTATYTVAAPAGAWSSADNGTYTISIVPGQVTDTSNNGVGAASGAFNVSASAADTQPPSGAISAPAIGSSGGSSQTVTVVYTDNIGINLVSLGAGNISVSGPGGPLTVTGESNTVANNGKTVTAKYTVAAPSGTWSATDDGTYNVALNANQVLDTSNNAAPVTFGSFAINIALPNPSDQTFAAGSAVSATFVAEAVVTEQDGKILVAGHQAASNGQTQAVIERLNADGSLDTTFGAGGQVVTPATGNNSWYAITIQGANHVVVAGAHDGDFALARYDFSGNLDPTFGGGGVTFTDFGSASDTAYGVALAPDGAIVAVGTSNNRFAFARYNANGILDASFGQGGRQLFDTGAATQMLGAVTVQNDGRVVAAGASGSSVDVVRLTANGQPDSTFNTDGVVVVPGLVASQGGGVQGYTESVGLQSDGKILVGKTTAAGHFGIARLTTDGKLDASFGSAGIAVANFGGQDDVDSIVMQDGGTILAVGTSNQNGTPQTAVAAFDANGQLITTFGNGGKVLLSPTVTASSRELHIGDLALRAFGSSTTGGRLLVGASETGTTTVSSTLRRLIVPGTKSAPGIQESLLGVFGLVNKKKTRLTIDLGGGRMAILTLTGGTGTALQSGTQIHLEITDLGKGASLVVAIKGGGTVTFSDITVTGSLKSMKAPAAIIAGTLSATGTIGTVTVGSIQGNVTSSAGIASLIGGDLAGTISATGAIGKLKLGNITGHIIAGGNIASLTAGNLSGSISAGGKIGALKLGVVTGTIAAASQLVSLTALSLSGATVLAGANLGSDGVVGGSAGDTFGAGTIGAVKITGAITGTIIAAGVNPVDNVFGNGNDTAAGTGLIKSLFAKGGATGSHFEATAFGSIKLPKKVNPALDPQFVVL
ncbi:MAG TPA: DNRLRE domain-containing protein [Tepidisphaeraceae bacterium]|nr:DNRLRE domain-containing protein [Tepidisphaeraceae bacterium]